MDSTAIVTGLLRVIGATRSAGAKPIDAAESDRAIDVGRGNKWAPQDRREVSLNERIHDGCT